MLFKSRKCILTVKTQVFCKIFILVFLSLLLIILARKYLKNTSKWVSKTSQNRSKTLLVLSWLSRVLSWSILGGFWVQVGRDLEAGGCVTNQGRCHKNDFREIWGLRIAQVPFWKLLGRQVVPFWIDFGRFLGATWEEFGRPRLHHEPSSLSWQGTVAEHARTRTGYWIADNKWKLLKNQSNVS